MPSSLENEIREHLAQYLDGRATLDAFEEWFAPLIWNIENAGDPGAEALAYEIELRLAERTHGHRTEDELRSSFESALGGGRQALR